MKTDAATNAMNAVSPAMRSRRALCCLVAMKETIAAAMNVNSITAPAA
jgi:hypothetical protein